ncbi:hypothetical protein AB8O38_17120 [Saccharomonospora xinjiangensis]|uniref:hypothetical protein n=1 Tax=Saccharomonospora xinjiangensis TaxID=75294 RepID=UPI00350FC9B9
MVRQERDRRGSESGADAPESGHLTPSPEELAALAPTDARRRAAEKVFTNEAALDARRHNLTVRPGHRERVERLLCARWREPVLALRLGKASGLGFDVPGLRPDGTVEGEQRVRQFFRNLGRGVAYAVGSVLFLASSGGGSRTSFRRQVHVKGPAGALALAAVEPFSAAKAPWLVCSAAGGASGAAAPPRAEAADAPEPRVLWEARRPEAPELRPRSRTLTWRDGSSFTFPLHDHTEERYLRSRIGGDGAPLWNGGAAAT